MKVVGRLKYIIFTLKKKEGSKKKGKKWKRREAKDINDKKKYIVSE